MAPEEEAPKSVASQPETPGSRPHSRRGRRSGRGRRGHGRRPPSKEAVGEPAPTTVSEPGAAEESIFELADERPTASEPPSPVSEPLELSETPVASRPVELASTSPAGSQPSVHTAIEEVNGIVDALRNALDDMEEVLEMLELFERQKNADEREIESLRRALRQMHRPRDGGHSR